MRRLPKPGKLHGKRKISLFSLFFACVVSQNGRDGQKQQKLLLLVRRSKENSSINNVEQVLKK